MDGGRHHSSSGRACSFAGFCGAAIGLLLGSHCTGTSQPLFALSESPLAAPLAGSGASPVPAGLDAGLASSDEVLDRDANFDWTETVPGQGTCQSGVYSGRVGCDWDPTLGTLLVPPTGAVTLTLGPATERKQLPVTEGSLGGFFLASVQGVLDCETNALHARSSDGRTLQLEGLMSDADMILSFPTFTANLEGRLDRATQMIEGVFEMTSDSGQTCTGRFRAQAMPNSTP